MPETDTIEETKPDAEPVKEHSQTDQYRIAYRSKLSNDTGRGKTVMPQIMAQSISDDLNAQHPYIHYYAEPLP